jgi:diguanylate cyclase (GGDEF)-like protein
MKEESQTDSSSAQINPGGLLKLMSLVAVVSMLVILSLTSYGIYRVFTHQVIQSAETDAVKLSQLIMAHEGNSLIGVAQKKGTQLTASKLEHFDRRFRTYLKPFDIVKIKIYNPQRKIIYSTDASIIGHIDDNNPRLENALAGHNDSKLESKETVRDLSEEQEITADVVETYVPIFGAEQQVLGCFELYLDVTRYRDEIVRAVVATTGILALILALVFGASFLVVRKGTSQLREAQENLRRIASTDPLTGAFNRGEILARARKEASRLRRMTQREPENSIALVMLDIDRFKLINDRHGHLAGDLVLRQMTRRIKIELRDYDLFGRYGGEEFLAVLPATDRLSAVSVAERMRRAVGDTPFDIEGQSLPITVSLGVSVLRGEALDLTGALKEADEALYRAKNAGRNQVCSSETT